jgi:hypothetical protein
MMTVAPWKWLRLRVRQAALLAAACVMAGCTTLGPASIQRDRTDYAGAIALSWKEQALLNIVKLRYGDVPVFLDVSSVIASSALESQVNLTANIFPAGSNNQSLGGYGRYTDRPTISYSPLTGDKFAKSFMRPTTPPVVFALVQAGYPIDRILQLTTRAINGVYNRSVSPIRLRAAEPQFYTLLETLRRVQRSESLGMRIERRGPEEAVVMFFPSEGISAATSRDIQTVRDILKVDGGGRELSLTFGTVPRNRQEIAMLTRSMAEIFQEIAATIEVPAQDIEEGRANPAPPPPDNPSPWDQPLVRVRAGAEQPPNAYAAVRYHGHWFWIDDRDLPSKTAFTFILVLFSLAETGSAPTAPVITIPAN